MRDRNDAGLSDRIRWNTHSFRGSPPTLKLEGAAPVGYRAFLIGGTRDPFLIAQIDSFVDGVMGEVHEHLGELARKCRIDIKVYGKDAVMGPMEPTPTTQGAHELGLLVQVLGPTPELAEDVCAFIDSRLIGFPYREAGTRTGHMAYPLCPQTQPAGPAFHYAIYHVAEVDRREEMSRIFPTE